MCLSNIITQDGAVDFIRSAPFLFVRNNETTNFCCFSIAKKYFRENEQKLLTKPKKRFIIESHPPVPEYTVVLW